MRVMLTILLWLAATPLALAAELVCDRFKWPVARERTLFERAGAGSDVVIGQAATLTLAPVETISFEPKPEKDPKAGTFGARFEMIVPQDGVVQITLSDEGWVDMIQEGRAVRAAGVTGGRGCPGLRKSVRFEARKGVAHIQLSGARTARLKLAALPPS